MGMTNKSKSHQINDGGRWKNIAAEVLKNSTSLFRSSYLTLLFLSFKSSKNGKRFRNLFLFVIPKVKNHYKFLLKTIKSPSCK